LLSVEQERQKQLEDNIPEIWTYDSVLYIGACIKRFHFKDALRNMSTLIDIVEIDDNRAQELEDKFDWLNTVYRSDVRIIDNLGLDGYDLVFWSHGPEMIPREDVDGAIDGLFKLTNKLCVLMCPWGSYHYRKGYNSKYMNMTALYEQDFEDLGFETATLGQRNVNGSNLLSWRYK